MAQETCADNPATAGRLNRYAIQDCEFSVRTIVCLQRYGRWKTLADLDAATDDEVLAIPHFGRKALKEVREIIKSVRFSALNPTEEVILWVSKHQSLIRALMNGEAVVVPASLMGDLDG